MENFKSIICLLLCAVALSSSAVINNRDCLSEETVNILHPHANCNKYYQCDAGKYIVRECQENLLFNVKRQRCDWPRNVECEGSVDNDSDENDDGTPVTEPEPESEIEPNPEPEPEPEDNEGGAGNNDPSEAANICATENSDGILVAHEYCNKFYICSAGNPVAMSCPGELFFNPTKDQCDYRENVNCDREVAPGPAPEPEDSDEGNGNENSSEDNNGNGNSDEDNNGSEGGGHGDPSEAPSICAADNSDSILVAHEYCNKFYICFAGNPVAMSCPGELFFNPSTDQCDHRENVNCDRDVAPGPAPEPEDSDEDNGNENSNEDNNISENSNEDNNGSEGGGHGDPSEAPSICAADGSDGILVAHEYCNKFYICFAGNPVAMPCPGELFFNPSTDQCDHRENVNCDRDVAPGPAPEPEDSDEDNGNENSNEDNNSSENGNEDNNGSEGGGHGDPSEAPSICAADGSDGILVAHEYCNKFYICSAGNPVAMSCPGELFFNPSIDQCDHRENVNCDREIAPGPAPEPEDSNEDNGNENSNEDNNGNENSDEDNNGSEGGGHDDPSEAPSICAANDSDGILVAHEYCNKFYICSAGNPVAMSCPGELFFNPSIDQCDHRENVNCDREVAPGPTPEPEESNEDNGNDNSNEDSNGNENSNEDNNGSEGGGHGDPSEAPSICATDDSDGILVAHEYCNKFYICFAGNPVAMSCPGELFFNPSTDQCDHRENVNCDRDVAPGPAPGPEDSDEGNGNENSNEDNNGNENSDEDNNGSEGGGHGDPSEASSICAADNSDGILVAHEYCNKFYKCFAGNPVAMSCPGELFFNPNTDQCDYRENVNCDRGVAPGPAPEPEDSDEDNENESSNEDNSGNGNSNEDNNGSEGGGHDDPSEASSICAADGSDGILIAHEYCNKFYKCFAGNPVAMSCPGELFFNPSTDQCDYRDNVNCDREVAPGPAPGPEDSNEDNGNENSNEDNNSNGNSIEDNNSNGNSNEDNNGSEGGGNGDPSEAPSICATDGSDGVLVAHEFCNKFYKCFAGNPVALSCPRNLVFNPTTDQCDWPENVDCDRDNAPEPDNSGENSNDNEENNVGDSVGNADPSQASSICAAYESEGILIAHEYCNKFYKCYAGNPVALSCPQNLFFNPSTNQCDWPENVGCDREVAPLPEPDNEENNSGDNTDSGNSNPSEVNDICADEGSDGVLVAHENCNQFYMCSEGIPVVLTCPLNLLYNPAQEICDWPENVNCENRHRYISVNKHILRRTYYA